MAYVEMYNEDVPGYGELMDVQTFITSVKLGSLVDTDGRGHPVKDNKMNGSVTIFPSQYRNIPKEATHIIWFNR